uniref:Uncharacterized protein n=1 Tax=Erwinia amylovora ATCC BAA-2158 TaxID=889211 RepID=E5B7Y1_ERWAM|nr:hypothetical protein predicted by Glimmer/Critica [Erwinia amylovora ATCC BAA-2158]
MINLYFISAFHMLSDLSGSYRSGRVAASTGEMGGYREGKNTRMNSAAVCRRQRSSK